MTFAWTDISRTSLKDKFLIFLKILDGISKELWKYIIILTIDLQKRDRVIYIYFSEKTLHCCIVTPRVSR